MQVSKDNMAAVDIAHMQCSRAWSLLRGLATKFDEDANRFEGDTTDALELIYTAMDLIAEASEAAGNAWQNGLDRSVLPRKTLEGLE